MDTFDQVLETRMHKTIFTGGHGAWKKVVIRPVVIKGKDLWQFSYFDQKKDISKNYDDKLAKVKLGQLKRQKYEISKVEIVEDLHHDKVKMNDLLGIERLEWLVKVGIQTQSGNIKVDKKDKWIQINQFLKHLREAWSQSEIKSRPVNVVDYGCGNAYLTFATAYFFKEVVRVPIVLTGIDINDEQVRRNNQISRDLSWEEVKFISGDIKNVIQDQVDIALSLHACDVASDKAIVKAVVAGAKIILVAPCCHHYLQVQLKARGPFELLFSDGVFKQRLGDILTDALRAGWIRSKDYKTDVVEFIDSKHTFKNLLIRALKRDHVNAKRFQREYQQLTNYWKIKPYL